MTADATPSMDLTDFPFMPLYVERLKKSKAWLRCKREPELAFYMLNLWMRAWHEIPAGSIEDDDDVLADAAMCDPRRWVKISGKVLEGWEKREDGRLHHSVVTEYAQEAWESKIAQRQRTEAARQAKSQAKLQALSKPTTESVTESVTDTVTASKGQGQGQGERESSAPDGAGGAPPTSEAEFEQWFWRVGKSALAKVDIPPDKAGKLLGKWKTAGRDVVISAINRALDRDCDANALVAYVEASVGGKRLNGHARSPPERKPMAPAVGTPEWHEMRRKAGAE